MSLTSSESHLNFPDNWFYFKDIYSCFVPGSQSPAVYCSLNLLQTMSKRGHLSGAPGLRLWHLSGAPGLGLGKKYGNDLYQYISSLSGARCHRTTLSFTMIMFVASQ